MSKRLCVFTRRRDKRVVVFFVFFFPCFIYVLIHVSTLNHKDSVCLCVCVGVYVFKRSCCHVCSQSCKQTEQCQCGSEGMCVPV